MCWLRGPQRSPPIVVFTGLGREGRPYVHAQGETSKRTEACPPPNIRVLMLVQWSKQRDPHQWEGGVYYWFLRRQGPKAKT